jgi:DNA-binding transcriptional LysR family regulator
LDSLGAYTAFVRAAESRSFTDAGRQLGVSSSAIGKAVGRLEERLGVRLFHRSTRGFALTHEGELFLGSCRRIFSEIEAVEREFAQTKRAPAGKLRVSLPVIGMLMTPKLGQFMRAYPEIELDLDFTDRLVDVIDGGYDVVVRTGEAADSRLIARTLGKYRLEVTGAPAYFARAGMPVTPADLAGHTCLHHRYPTTGKLQRWPFAMSSESDAEIVLPVSAAVSTVEPLVSLAEAGVGIVCVPDFAIRQQVADGRLVTVLGEHIEHKGVFRALWPSSRYIAPKLRAFIDFLARNLFASDVPSTDRIFLSDVFEPPNACH